MSSDIVGSPASLHLRRELTMAMGNLVKVLGWYDNEWGYSNRLVDLTAIVGAKLDRVTPPERPAARGPAAVDGKRVLLRADFNVPLERRRDDHRRPPHPRRAAHDRVAAGAGRDGRRVQPPRPAQGQAGPAVLDGAGPGPAGRAGARRRAAREPALRPGRGGQRPGLRRPAGRGQDAYVNDAFGASHRAHASIVGPPRTLPVAAGRLLAQEVEVLARPARAPAAGRSSPCSAAPR